MWEDGLWPTREASTRCPVESTDWRERRQQSKTSCRGLIRLHRIVAGRNAFHAYEERYWIRPWHRGFVDNSVLTPAWLPSLAHDSLVCWHQFGRPFFYASVRLVTFPGLDGSRPSGRLSQCLLYADHYSCDSSTTAEFRAPGEPCVAALGEATCATVTDVASKLSERKTCELPPHCHDGPHDIPLGCGGVLR